MAERPKLNAREKLGPLIKGGYLECQIESVKPLT